MRKDKATARYARYKLGKVQVPAAGEYRLEATATLDRESTKAELLLD